MTPPAAFPPRDSDGYVLDRSHAAATRLNLQHYLWKEALGFNIAPSVELSPSALIADVACGTGLWLSEVAREHPDARLHGFDTDLSQVPHTSWLPSNIELSEWDIFEDVPEQWREKFDLVHVRLLLLVLTGVELKPVIRRFLQLLKPGGYLQWDENNCAGLQVLRADSSLVTPALDQMRNLMYSDGGHDWVLKIPECIKQEGIDEVGVEHFGDPQWLARSFTDVYLLTLEELASTMIKTGKEEQGQKIFGLVNAVYAESLKGGALHMPRVVVVARKTT